ncbi:MAG: DNA polymerase IV [Ruminococcaceae bacterium]|nr:DNA polymerase IV [Oscillospiraceae bacterium]
MERIILHCDLNSFFASVECLFNPDLKNVPMAVAGNPKSRHGIILAKNELAKKYNVKTAETIWQAKLKCPDLVLVPPHHDKYYYYSQIVNGIYQKYTDLVEPFGIDESWLDVTGSTRIFGSGLEIAQKISNEVKEETGLTLSIGVSFNKVFAKLGSDYKKPDAITEISRENVEKIVYPLPVTDLLFVGRSTLKHLDMLNIKTIGDLAKSNKEILKKLMGKQGETIWNYANGIDEAPVLKFDEQEREKSVGNSITFTRNLCSEEEIKSGIMVLCDEVAMRLRMKGLKCQYVQLGIKSEDLKTITRRCKTDVPTNLAVDLYSFCINLFEKNWSYKTPVRLLSVTGGNLIDENSFVQEDLFYKIDSNKEKYENMEKSMDTIRKRFGNESVVYGSTLKNETIKTHSENEDEYDEN